MNDEQLRAALERLRTEVSGVTDAAARARIEALIQAIEYQLAHHEDEGHGSKLRDNLNASIGQFEAEHPRLTTALNQIVSALSSMGI